MQATSEAVDCSMVAEPLMFPWACQAINNNAAKLWFQYSLSNIYVLGSRYDDLHQTSLGWNITGGSNRETATLNLALARLTSQAASKQHLLPQSS